LTDSPNIRLWGNKEEWIFDQSYQCICIANNDVKSFPNCIVCHGDSVIEKEIAMEPEQIDEEYKEIFSKIKRGIGDDKDSDG